MAALSAPAPHAAPRIRLSRRAALQIGIFLFAYLLYSAARRESRIRGAVCGAGAVRAAMLPP